MRKTITLMLPILALGPGACAGQPTEVSAKAIRKSCVDVSKMTGWTKFGDRAVMLTVGAGQKVLLTLAPTADLADLATATTMVPKADAVGELCGGTGVIFVDGRRIRVERVEPQPKG